MTMKKQLFRDEDNAMLAGVCAGLADYLDRPVFNVRLAFCLLTPLTGFGFGIVTYLVLWALLPPMHLPRNS